MICGDNEQLTCIGDLRCTTERPSPTTTEIVVTREGQQGTTEYSEKKIENWYELLCVSHNIVICTG